MNATKYYIVLAVCLIPGWSAASEAALYLSPQHGTYSIGEVFEVRVHTDSGGIPIHAAESDLSFNPAALMVESISTEASILTAWSTEPTFSNEAGTVRFSGWTTENFSGSDGLLVTVRFKALRNVPTGIAFVGGAILAADGYSSNIAESLRSGQYAIEPRRVTATPPFSYEDTDPNPRVLGVRTRSPLFTDYETNIRVGDRIVVKGIADPDSSVTVRLQKGDTSREYGTMSSSDGSFVFVSDEGSEEGVYRLSAETEYTDGTRGTPSERIIITARPVGIAAAASSGVLLLSTSLPFLLTLVISGLGVGYLFHLHAFKRRKGEEYV